MIEAKPDFDINLHSAMEKALAVRFGFDEEDLNGFFLGECQLEFSRDNVFFSVHNHSFKKILFYNENGEVSCIQANTSKCKLIDAETGIDYGDSDGYEFYETSDLDWNSLAIFNIVKIDFADFSAIYSVELEPFEDWDYQHSFEIPIEKKSFGKNQTAELAKDLGKSFLKGLTIVPALFDVAKSIKRGKNYFTDTTDIEVQKLTLVLTAIEINGQTKKVIV